MAINRFERVLSTLLHEETPAVPQVMRFTNEMARVKFLLPIEAGIREIGLKSKNGKGYF